MYSTFNLLTESKAAYLKGYWGNTDFEYVAKYCKEENWPSGISSLSARDKVRAQMNNYKAYRIAEFDGKCILKIPADENKFMPYDMRPAQDIFFVINTTDVTVGGSATGSTSSSYKSTSTSSKTLSYSKNDIGKAVHIAQGATLMDDLESMDYYNESKEQMDATEYQNALKYSKRENWPSGISTKEARETNSAKIADYKGIIVAHFIDDYDLGSYVIKIAPKANSHMPSNMRPATTVYVLVDEYDVDLD